MSFSIKFDYRFDTEGFFDDPARRAALDAAAGVWESIIQDEFDDVPAGISFTIRDPSDGFTERRVTLTEPIDDMLVFVGARHLETALGRAGPDGYSAQGDVFSARITSDFRGTGPVTDFEPWAGTIVFDLDGNWSFDIDGPVLGKNDFISVALHEIGHILGHGTSAAFDQFDIGGAFNGPNALQVNNGQPIPLESSTDQHVRDGIRNDSVLMDPSLTTGTRTVPTDIDKAILADIGYEIAGFSHQGTQPPIATDNGETIFGTVVADMLSGGGGDDQIQGNNGNDTLDGGSGTDVLFGGDGVDTFVLRAASGGNRVLDFDVAREVIQLIDSGFASVSEVLATISKPFLNVSRVTLSDGSYMDVFHTSQSGTPLTATNFILSNPGGASANDDTLLLVSGDETRDGLEGRDTAVVETASSNFTLSLAANGALTLLDRNGTGGRDTLINIEELKFSDTTIDLTDVASLVSLSPAQFDLLTEMYVAYFNRAADSLGLYFWADKLAEDSSLEEIANLFFNQPETQELYPNSNDPAAFVDAVYTNVLGRTPDAAGAAFWQDTLTSGTVGEGTFVLEIIRGAKNGGSAEDVAYLSAKTDLGVYFATVLGLSDVEAARDVMQAYGTQAATNLAEAKSAADAYHASATEAGGGSFTFQLIGIVDDPFAVA